MYVSKLTVYNFRNLLSQTVQLRNGPVYVSGLNGNGKTNLVEALYLLSGSRSFRTNSNAELIAWGAREASIFGTIERRTGSEELGIAFTPGQRTAFKNGDQQSSVTELVGCCSVVAFSPSDLSLVKGSPAVRRRFLDRHMVDLHPSFLHTLMAYQRALASKSALLKNPSVDIQQLRPWNELLADYGASIVENRANFLKSLSEKARSFLNEFATEDGQLSLTLESECMSDAGQVDRAAIVSALERVAPREIAQRTTVFGAHRDDMTITIRDGINARSFASQGQTRSIVLALILGVIELLEEKLGESPIVVLDDVDSELDAPRAKKLFSALGKRERQLIITGTATPPQELIHGVHQQVQVVEIREGKILDS